MSEIPIPPELTRQPDRLPSPEEQEPAVYDALEYQRKEYVFEKSRRTVLRFANELDKLADPAAPFVSLTSGFATDESIATYIRDYQPLVEAGIFVVEGESEYIVTVIPAGIEDKGSSIIRAKEILDQQPFRQELRDLASSIKEATDKAKGAGQIEIQTALTSESACVPYLDELFADPDYPVHTALQEDGVLDIIVDLKDTEDNEDTLFLHSPSAKKLIQALGDAGYGLDQRLIDELVQEKDHRYGNAYAWISRQLVKKISGYPGDLLIPETETTQIQPTGDAGADLIIDIINQLSRRQPGSDTHSDIPATTHDVELRDRGCKDAEDYFVQGEGMGKVSHVSINDKKFWQNTHGGGTYINLEPIAYKGIELPPGFIFKQSETDGSYALLRATAFAFDQARGDQLFDAASIQSSHDPKFLEQKAQLFVAFTHAAQSL